MSQFLRPKLDHRKGRFQMECKALVCWLRNQRREQHKNFLAVFFVLEFSDKQLAASLQPVFRPRLQFGKNSHSRSFKSLGWFLFNHIFLSLAHPSHILPEICLCSQVLLLVFQCSCACLWLVAQAEVEHEFRTPEKKCPSSHVENQTMISQAVN